MEKISRLIVRFRIPIIVIFLGLTVFFALQLPRAEIDSEFKNMLPKDVEARRNTDKIEDIFGGTDMLMVLFETDDVLNPETLRRVENISRDVSRLKGVDKVLSLFDLKNIESEGGWMVVEPAVPEIPENEQEREELRQDIKDNDMVYETVVSADFSVTTVIISVTNEMSDPQMVNAVQEVVEKYPGEAHVRYGGLPYARVEVAQDMQGDLSNFLPFGLVIMLVFLYIAFKQIRGVLLPFGVVVMSIIFGMGLIPIFGWKIMIITILLPVILIAVANDYGIHMIAKYQEDNVEGHQFTRKNLAQRMFRSLAKPIVLTGITTMGGMLCLLSHILTPAKQLAVLAALGIMYALAASLMFIPAVSSLLPIPKPVVHQDEEKKHFLERLLVRFGEFVPGNPKGIIVVFVVVALISAVGIFFIEIDANPENYYDDDHPLVQTTHLINEKFGGSQNIAITVHGDIKSPEMMNKINMYEQKLRDMPQIGTTSSIARVVKQMSRALLDKDDTYYDKIPQSRNAIAQYFELYSMSGDPEDFEKMVDFTYENALITGRINTLSTPELRELKNNVEEMTKGDEHVTYVGGWGLIFFQLATAIINGQILSLLFAMVLVAVFMILQFRSLSAGAIAAVPLAISLTILFGLMGVLGIELNVATAMLSSIMIGVGIDYTIHFLWRYREERHNGQSYPDAVKKTLTTTGRGITFNALSVIIGFSVLLASNFQPVRFFGFLVFVSIFACLIGALILVPALCLVLKPKFLEPNQ